MSHFIHNSNNSNLLLNDTYNNIIMTQKIRTEKKNCNVFLLFAKDINPPKALFVITN
jgi:hypothetical protein